MESSCCIIMKPNELVNDNSMSQHPTIKREDGSPATTMASDALDYVFQHQQQHHHHHDESSNSMDANSLMFDLQELLKRDPTLSSLDPAKEEPREEDMNGGGGSEHGMPIPQAVAGHPHHHNAAAAVAAAGSAFGGSSSVSSNLTASPLLASPPQPAAAVTSFGMAAQATGGTAIPPHVQSIRHPVPVQSMDTTPPPNANLFEPAGAAEVDLDLDASNDFFTNAASRNVSLCPQSQEKQRQQQQQLLQLQQQQQQLISGIKTEPGAAPQLAARSHQQGPVSLTGSHFLQADDSLIFSTTSVGGHSGGSTFTSPAFGAAAAGSSTSKDLLSSSVPVTVFNSPLSDILTDLSPSGAGGGGGLGGSPNSPSVSPRPSPSNAPGPDRHSTLHKLLLRKEHGGNTGTSHGHRPSPVRSPEGRNKTLDQMKSSLSASNPLLCQQLSKSAPAPPHHPPPNYLDRVLWARREPRQHMSSVCSVGESSVADEVNDVLSGLSPNELPDISDDDEEEEAEEGASEAAEGLAHVGIGFGGGGTIEDDDREEGGGKIRSRAGSSASGIRPRAGSASSNAAKKERHFWQYNVQAKGPKGQKIVVPTKIDDPHVLNDIVDPVFSGDVQLQGIKHSGKARRGDGNDLTPNARKLAAIGKELDQLTKVITDLTPVSDMPFNTRCKSRKEKNKLASRACRLKKKAQHEANKLKCHGLEEEHYNLTTAIARAREILRAKVDPNLSVAQTELTSEVDQAVSNAMQDPVAGQTAEFVNRQIQKFVKNM